MKDKIWIEEPADLFLNFDLVPNNRMSKEERINCITRIVLLIFLVMYFLKYKYSLQFLFLSLLIILILYFINTKECFSNMDRPIQYKNKLLHNEESRKKMSLAPVIVPRSHDRDVWSAPSYRHSAINYNSGKYDITEEYLPPPENYTEDEPHQEVFTGFNLENIGDYCKTKIGSTDGMSDEKETIKVVNPINDKKSNLEKFSSTPINKVVEGGDLNNFRETPNERKMPFLPNQNLLIPKTIQSVYNPRDATTEERVKYLSRIQPDVYSYSETYTPINSNIGITYTPQNSPFVLDQVATPYGTNPLYHRIDPQLIRETGPKDRINELPRRTAWSAKYSGFEAAPGTVNFEDIYDPRFNGYGDEYRSYGDVNLGQVQYYYSDIDAYRYPNFGVRSKVDYIDYIDPMGKVLPEYDRNVGLEDVKETVHDQYNADALYFREDLQEKLMRKRNRELWQLRAMPLRKDAHASSFTSHY